MDKSLRVLAFQVIAAVLVLLAVVSALKSCHPAAIDVLIEVTRG